MGGANTRREKMTCQDTESIRPWNRERTWFPPLDQLEEGELYPVDVERLVGWRLGKLLEIGDRDYLVDVDTGYETRELWVSASAFRPEVEEIEGCLTDMEFNGLEKGDVVDAYLKGFEVLHPVVVKNVDKQEGEVYITGECRNQTVDRGVDRRLVRVAE
jgi:hypothetical protein